MADNPNYSKYDLGPTRRDGKERPRKKKLASDEDRVPAGSSTSGSNFQYNFNGNNNDVRYPHAMPSSDGRNPPFASPSGDTGSADRRRSRDDVDTLNGAHYKRFSDLNADTPVWVEQATDTELLERVHRSFRQIKTKWTPNSGKNDPTSSSIASKQADSKRPSRPHTAAKQQRKPFRRSVKLMFVGALIVVLGVAIAIPVWIFTSKDESKSERNLQRFDLQSKVSNQVYSAPMADPTSNDFKQFAAEFCQGIEAHLGTSTKGYRGCVVTELKNGSVVVSYTIVVLTSAKVTKEALVTVITAGSTTGSSGTAMFQIGNFLLLTASTTVISSTAITADENPIAPRAAYGGTCTPEGKTIGCQTLGATCLKTCTCLQHQYYNQLPDECALIDCGPAPTINNGNAIANKGSNYSNPLTIQCDDGFELSNDTAITCQTHSKWPSNIPTCNKVQCTSLLTPEHASLDPSATHGDKYKDTKTFICDAGYTIVGDAIVTCQSNKTWSSIPSCTLTGCPGFSLPNNSKLNTSASSGESVGETKTVVCDEGYSLKGNATVTCLPEQVWSPGPTCEPNNCTKFILPPNAILDPASPNGESFKETKTLVCETGYSMSGESVVTCKADQSWSESPTCNRVSCGTYQTPSHATIDQSSGDLYTDTITIDCEAGYIVKGTATVTCNADGNWTDPGPTCEPIKCNDFNLPTNAKLDQSAPNGDTFNKTKTLICDDGYTVVGDAIVTCQSNKTWSSIPSCTLTGCPGFSLPNNSKLNTSAPSGESVGETKTVVCDEGYSLKGNATVTCLPEQVWSPGPTCEPNKCTSFNIPPNAILDPASPNGEFFNETKTLVCETGYLMSGESVVTCKADQSWSESPTCNRVSCGTYQTPPHATIGQSSAEGNTITIDCEAGYKVKGNATVTCDADGNWTDPGPTCEPIKCNDYILPTNAKLDPSSPNGESFKETKTLVCETGYLMSGEAVVTCKADKSWSESPTCDPVSCGEYQPPIHGNIDPPNAGGNLYGNTVTINCEAGYTVTGNATVACNADGNWTDPGPTCEPIKCNDFILPTNAILDPSSPNGESFKETKTLVCETGYLMTGEAVVTCKADKSWSESPTCDPVSCGEYQPPLHGNIDPPNAGGNLYGNTVTINCEAGYTVTGNATVTCNADGHWTDPGPKCEPIKCNDFILPPNAKLDSSSPNGESFKETKTLVCETGYTMTGEAVVTCKADQSWSESPTCNRVSCGTYQTPPRATIAQSSGILYADTITIDCEAGYIVKGTATVTCNADGNWTDPGPTCEPIKCNDFILPTNAKLDPSAPDGTSFNETKTLVCEEGYILKGEAVVTCQSNESWSESPACDPVSCGEYQPPPNVKVDPSSVDGHVYGDTVIIDCVDGYNVNGNSTVTCNADANWSEVTCVIDKCDNLNLPPNADFSDPAIDGTNISYGTYIEITCQVSTVFTGKNNFTCNPDGTWNSFECVSVGCNTTDFKIPENGNIASGNATVFVINCNMGYSLRGGIAVITCENGQWGDRPECVLVNCGDPPYIDDADITFSNTTFSSIATVECKNGYTTNGTGTMQCLETGNWSLTTTCQVVNCGDPEIYKNSAITSNSSATVYGSTFQIECQHGYKQMGSNIIVCLANGTWSSSPTCEVIDCGEFIPPSNSSVPKTVGTHYGVSKNITCDVGFEMSGDASVACQLDGQWSESPICHIINCSTPITPEKGTVTLTSGSVVFNSTATIKCEVGYHVVGNDTITCQASGQWTDYPTCEFINCGPNITAPLNGNISYVKETTYNSTALILCNAGYAPDSNDTITCDKTGSWSIGPSCIPVDCGTYTPNARVVISEQTTTVYKSVIKLECATGNQPVGGANMEVTCQADQSWSTGPECSKVGLVYFSQAQYIFPVGDEGLIQCNVSNTADWTLIAIFKPLASEEDPLQTAVFHVNQTGGKYASTSVDGFTETAMTSFATDGATIELRIDPVQCGDGGEYECGVMVEDLTATDSGPDFKTNSSFIIVKDTSMSPSLQVDPSAVMENLTLHVACSGNVSKVREGDTTSDVNIQVKYQASDVFENIANGVTETTKEIGCYKQIRKELTVNATSDWDKAVVRCVTVDIETQQLTSEDITITVLANCGELSTVKNGDVTAYEGGIYATVVCKNGYQLHGSANISCQQTGQWSTPPDCKVADCGALGSVENGHVVQNANSTTYNSTGIFGCDVGYNITGRTNVTCQSDGTWSDMPSCALVDCGQYTLPTHSQVVNSTGTAYGSTVYIRCDDGFYPLNDDHTSVTCDGNGDWTSALDIPLACNTIGSVKFSSDNYSVNANTNLTIVCSIRNAANWTLVALAKPDFSGEMLYTIQDHNPMDGNKTDNVILDLSQSDVTSLNDATIYVAFTPVQCSNAGYYTCGVTLGDPGQEPSAENSKTDLTYIHVNLC